MAPLPEGTGQPPGVRLITLAHFRYGRGSQLLLLELTLAVDVGLSSLHAMLPLEPPSVALQKASSAITAFTASERQQGSVLLEFTGLTMFPHLEATALMDG